MEGATFSLDPDAILAKWQALRDTGAHLHAPEIARSLRVSEAALVASRIGSGAIRLQPDLAKCLAPIADWGRVLCAFSSPSGVHMPLGTTRFEFGEKGALRLMGDHIEASIDASAIAEMILFEDEDKNHGKTRSLQFFDVNGAAIVKAFIFHKTAYRAAQHHFEACLHANQSRQAYPRACLEIPPDSANWHPTPNANAQAALEQALVTGRPLKISAYGLHAKVSWNGILNGIRFAREMLHLHEPSLRSHLRLAPLTHTQRTSNAITLGSKHSPILRITTEETPS